MIINARTLESFKQETKFFGLCGANVYIHKTMWTAIKTLRRQSYHRGTHFTTSLTWKVSVVKAISMYSRFRLPQRNTLGCYHKPYLKTDVLRLPDIFATFQTTYLKLQVRSSSLLHSIWICIAFEYYEHEKSVKKFETSSSLGLLEA